MKFKKHTAFMIDFVSDFEWRKRGITLKWITLPM